MTIVSTEDNRNSSWARDKSAFGHRMLAKMGWTEGQGLGKNQQGSKNHLRGVRRTDENLGIGAKTDAHGFDGWEETRGNYQSVLAKLREVHGGSDDAAEKKKKKKKTKRKVKSGVVLPQNKVTAGHARKMREAKDISKKSHEDMAAIFGVRKEHYGRERQRSPIPAFPVISVSKNMVNVTKKDNDDDDDDDDASRKKDRKRKRRVESENDAITDDSNDEKEKKKKKRKKEKRDKKKEKRRRLEEPQTEHTAE